MRSSTAAIVTSQGRASKPGGSVTGDRTPRRHGGESDSGAIRLLLVDDHVFVRTALAETLSEEADLTVVGACVDGSQVVEATTRLKPDVVCMDVSMPMMNGFEATEALRTAKLDVRVVLLTAGTTTPLAAAAVGADALVPKSGRPAHLLSCLRSIAAGEGTSCPYCL
jgi:DNA-binding NarL/FixJ family response regulator